jgi:glycosyltransferase involved in cell wall biosynthesis
MNGERYLGQAIDSVRTQSYSNWELLLVDDGSSDGSTAIAKLSQADDPQRIRHLEHPERANRGATASRNLGIEKARGEFLGFLDQDDVYLPFKLEREVPLLLAHPDAGMVVGQTLFVHEPGGRPDLAGSDHVPQFEAFGLPPDRLYQPPELLIRLLEDENSHPALCAVLARRSFCLEVGGFDRPEPDVYDDSTLLVKAYLQGPVFLSSGCSSAYRLNPGSRSLDYIDSGQFDPSRPNPARAAFLEWVETRMESEGITDRTLWHSLRWEQLPYRDPAKYRRTQVFAGLFGYPARIARSAIAPARSLRRWIRSRIHSLAVWR